MNRRAFLKFAAMIAPMARMQAFVPRKVAPEIAFTFDDPKTDASQLFPSQELNQHILDTLKKRKLRSILFVCGKRVDSEAGRNLVASWDRAGHDIGNHSYSHLFFNAGGGDDGEAKVSLGEFEADALRNEPLIRDYIHFTRLFRYPFFKEGDTVEKRDGMRSFLLQHGYRIGRVTIDASDWAIDGRLETHAKANPAGPFTPYRHFYLQHIWERAQYYDSIAQRTLNRAVRHTVLLHHNALNALFLDELIGMFISKGWSPIDAARAYSDPVYDLQPKTLPAGESLLWALAKQSGKFDGELRYPGEDDVYENPKMDALRL